MSTITENVSSGTEKKHTPGEWYLCDDGTIRSRSFGGDQMADYRGSIICDMKAGLGHGLEGTAREHAKPETLANARLIIAAPELLEALKIAEPLLTTLCSVALKAEVTDHLPFGLKDQVEEWLRGNIDGKAISKAERGQ